MTIDDAMLNTMYTVTISDGVCSMDNVRNEIHIKRYPAKTLRFGRYMTRRLGW